MHILVIPKPSTYQLYSRHRSRNQVDRLLAQVDPAVAHVKEAHEAHLQTVEQTRVLLRKMKVQADFKRRVPDKIAEHYDLVITLGGDGTLLRASHSVGSDIPMLAINSAPSVSVGYFCGGSLNNLEDILDQAVRHQLKPVSLSRMQIMVDENVISSRVLNDALFGHESPALPCRYVLDWHGQREDQRSSGVWIGPAAGSTAALRSAGGQVLSMTSKDVQFVVREPYLGAKQPVLLTKGLIHPGEALTLESKIRDGMLFIDGAHVALPVYIGSRIRATLSPEPLLLLGKSESIAEVLSETEHSA